MTGIARRRMMQAGLAAAVLAAPAIVRAGARPAIVSGLQLGDPTEGRAVVWAQADRPARLIAEWDTSERFATPRRAGGALALPERGLTARLDLDGLPHGSTVHVRAWFEDLDAPGLGGPPEQGRLRMAGLTAGHDVTLAWSGDQVGQGYGIDPSRGGLSIFSAIAATEPDLFVHSGDQIYADSPLVAERTLTDGTVWRNLVTPAKAKVAETLEDYRGNYAYNLLDEHVRRFHAAVPKLAQWDDHEVVNNWYPGRVIEDRRYAERRCDVLAAHARRAFFDMNPMRESEYEPGRIYRRVGYGPLLDVFLLDGRSYRGPNWAIASAEGGKNSAYLGDAQLEWLKRGLARSTALWKVVANDMPIGVPSSDDGIASLPGLPCGREFELVDLLSFLRDRAVANVVWLTADVHHAAALHYDPAQAWFRDFDPFWEFIAGPLHAVTFHPQSLDDTFGPERRFIRPPPHPDRNAPPHEGFQSFGTLTVSARTRAMTVRLLGGAGELLWTREIEPA